MKKRSKEHRINLRLSGDAFAAIEELRREGIGKLSYNAWVAEAIQEKIERDWIRETEVPEYGDTRNTFYEFFAGGGMARLGLGEQWRCLFANDFDPMKARAYRENWKGGRELRVEDINKLTTADLPGNADMVWASFPCQDLSLAGKYAGIGRRHDPAQTRSGSFWPFWRLIDALGNEGRKPKLIVLENVYGVLTANQGRDFSAICDALLESGYLFGAVVIDAKLFVPQSRPRVFIVGIQQELSVQADLVGPCPAPEWHVDAVQAAYGMLSPAARRQWLWWHLPSPPQRRQRLAGLIQDDPEDVDWHSATETKRLLAMMSPLNLKKVKQVQALGKRFVGGVYKRTRTDANGLKVQRAEVRFDDIAGCLRTPSGGSSRQQILVVEKESIRSRLMSSREAARLMGLPEDYKLPKNYNDAYHLCGDGVAVPAVRHLADHLLAPLLDYNQVQSRLSTKVA